MYLVLAVSVLFAACCLPSIAGASTLKNTVDIKPDFSFQELWDLEKSFWDTFLYPANLKQVNVTGDISVFAEDVQGRVDITRTFDGRELNSEYIFGLFSEPDHVSLVGVPLEYHITEFTANQNIASATTVVIFNSTTFGLILPLTIDTWIEWNAEHKIIQYDATFRWFDYAVATLFEAAAQKLNTTDTTAVQAAITQLLSTTICQTHENYCTGKNLQYNSTEVCLDFLTNKIRFGQPYELGRNTLLCREVHEHMVKYRPDVHCAHIGPTGGNYCVDDQSYRMVVMNKYFTNSFIPYGYGADQNIWLAGS